MNKNVFLAICIDDEDKKSAVILSTDIEKACHLAHRVFFGSEALKVIATMELKDLNFRCIYAKLNEEESIHLVEHDFVELEQKMFDLAYAMMDF